MTGNKQSRKRKTVPLAETVSTVGVDVFNATAITAILNKSFNSTDKLVQFYIFNPQCSVELVSCFYTNMMMMMMSMSDEIANKLRNCSYECQSSDTVTCQLK